MGQIVLGTNNVYSSNRIRMWDPKQMKNRTQF